jgi:hypothetical protein
MKNIIATTTMLQLLATFAKTSASKVMCFKGKGLVDATSHNVFRSMKNVCRLLMGGIVL